jgi:S-adenosylmethionine hydrolase
MAIITFTSDFGLRDHYVASVKAKMLSLNPNLNIVDISHEIEHFNISHAAFVLGAVFRDFPQGSVHLVAINSQGKEDQRFVAMKMEEHYFVGPDNGLFSLLSDRNPSVIVELQNDPLIASNFPEKNIMAPVAASLANGRALYDIGKQLTSLERLINRQVRYSKNELEGRVAHVDNYGNLITNIKWEDFVQVGQNRQARIRVGRTWIEGLSGSYFKSEGGDCICLFNSSSLLEISIIQGHASKLLGMKYDSPVTVSFSPLFE